MALVWGVVPPVPMARLRISDNGTPGLVFGTVVGDLEFFVLWFISLALFLSCYWSDAVASGMVY